MLLLNTALIYVFQVDYLLQRLEGLSNEEVDALSKGAKVDRHNR